MKQIKQAQQRRGEDVMPAAARSGSRRGAGAAGAARAQRARVNERHVFTQQRAGVGG